MKTNYIVYTLEEIEDALDAKCGTIDEFGYSGYPKSWNEAAMRSNPYSVEVEWKDLAMQFCVSNIEPVETSEGEMFAIAYDE